MSQLLDAGKSLVLRWDLAPTSGWYEFVITVDQDPEFARHFAGHVETGQNSISDPKMAGLL
jgi:phospholipase C